MTAQFITLQASTFVELSLKHVSTTDMLWLIFFLTPVFKNSGVMMGWLLRLVTGGPTAGRGSQTVLEFLVINFRGPDLRK